MSIAFTLKQLIQYLTITLSQLEQIFYSGSGISLGKISKLCIQSGSDNVAVVAKIISDKKEFLTTSIFFRNNIICFETTAQYNGELEPYEDEDDE